MTRRSGVLGTLEGRTSTLFLAAGGLFVVFAACHGVEAFTNRAAPKDVFGPAGFLFAFLGMLGLYPNLSDRSRRLSRFGALFATIGTAASAVTSAWHVGLWVFPAIPDFAALFGVGMLLGQFLGYVPLGVASWRSDAYPGTVGLLLLAVPTALGVMIVTVATGFATSGSAAVLGSAQALIHLAIGGSLRTAAVSSDRAEPVGEAAPK